MKKTIVAFIRLGRECSGCDVGEYGQFDVELTADEQAQIDEVIQSGAKGYLRKTLKERYPELDRKIVEAAQELIWDTVVFDGLEYVEDIDDYDTDIMLKDYEEGKFELEGASLDTDDDEDVEAALLAWRQEDDAYCNSLSNHERAKLYAERYDLTPDDEMLASVDVCYYLTKEEIPDDYRG